MNRDKRTGNGRNILEGSIARLSLQNPLGSNHEALKAAGPSSWGHPQCPIAPSAPVWVAGLLYGEWSGWWPWCHQMYLPQLVTFTIPWQNCVGVVACLGSSVPKRMSLRAVSERLRGHIFLSSEAYRRECGAKWLRRKGSDLARVIRQLVESDDTLRTIFFGTMSSLQPFYNHTVSLSTSAYLPGSSPVATTRQKPTLPGYAAGLITNTQSSWRSSRNKTPQIARASILRSWRENASRIWQGHLAPGAYIPYSQAKTFL